MRKVLILGVNAGQADIIRYFKAIGWEVHACGNKQEGPGVELAHHFHIANTAIVDEVVELAKMIEVEIIYSVSSDLNIRTATNASELLNLPVIVNSEIIDLFHHKHEFRNFLNNNKISEVGFKRINSFEEAKEWELFPCVVKPTDSQGQRGVALVEKRDNFEGAVRLALEQSSTNTVILEEYLEGVEFSAHVIVQNGEIIVIEYTERPVHGKKYFGLPKGHYLPLLNVSEQRQNEATVIINKFVEKLNLEKAVLYIQMIATEKGPKIIEVAPRLDGCHIWRLVTLSKGYDLREYAVSCLLDIPIKHKEKKLQHNYTLGFYQLPPHKPFKKDSVEIKDELLFNEWRYEEGETIKPINGELEVVGYYVKKND